jgi:hypothetical protein
MNVKAFYNYDTINLFYEEGKIRIDTTHNFDFTEKIILDSAELIKEVSPKITSRSMSDCYMEIQFILTPVCTLPKLVKINGIGYFHYSNKFKIHPLKFEVVKGDTLNYTDEHGWAQGKWNKIFCFREIPGNQHSVICVAGGIYCGLVNEKYEFEGFYVDGEVKTAKCEVFYPDGCLKAKLTQTDFDLVEVQVFDINGSLRYTEMNKYHDWFYIHN